jgi:hypothetical protein
MMLDDEAMVYVIGVWALLALAGVFTLIDGRRARRRRGGLPLERIVTGPYRDSPRPHPRIGTLGERRAAAAPRPRRPQTIGEVRHEVRRELRKMRRKLEGWY